MVSITALIAEYRNNRKILLLIVYVALFLDNMLLTTVGKFKYFMNIKILKAFIECFNLVFCTPVIQKITGSSRNTEIKTTGLRETEDGTLLGNFH